MRRRRAVAPVLIAGALVAVPIAPAATPKPGASFAGTGTSYANNAPTWHRASTKTPFSFKTNSTSTRIISFNGQFSAYCNVPSANVTAAFMTVAKSGAFSYRFAIPRKFRGKTIGRTYVWIYGTFKSSRTASLSYLVNIGGLHDKDPYDTGKPSALGCATWVRGTARVH
jgi:hypothetical protein